MKRTNFINKKISEQSAITLVALVVTIIVLLILAGVTISTLTGNNGLLQKAGQAKNTTIEAEGLEKIQLAVMASYDKREINTTSLAKNLSQINGLTDTNNNSITDQTEITLPKNIKLNNFKYKIKVDGTVIIDNPILPDEYQQVEYIESTGTQYIFIGKVGISNVTAEIQYPNYPTVGSVNGGMDGSGNKGRLSIGIDRGSLTYFFGFGDKAVGSQVSGDSKKHTYNLNISNDNNKIAELFVDNIFIYSQTANNLSNPLYFTLFAYTGWGQITPNQFASCRIFKFELEGQMKLYPCYRKSDNVIGMYDTVEGKFYTNQGTGTFGYGMEDGTYVAPTNN